MMAAMLVNAFHAAFEDREEPFNGVGVDFGVFLGNVFILRVINYAMLRELAAQHGVIDGFVSHELGFLGDTSANQGSKGAGLEIVNHDAPGTTAIAINQSQNLVFMMEAAPLLHTLGLNGAVMADEGFIYFHRAAAAPEHFKTIGFHGFADTMSHEPSSLEGHAQSPVELVGADTLLAGRNQEDGLQPEAQGDMAGLENGPDLDGKGLAAVVALIGAYAGALAAHLADTLKAAAMRAYRAIRPDASLYILVGRFFVVELGFGKNAHGCSPIR